MAQWARRIGTLAAASLMLGGVVALAMPAPAALAGDIVYSSLDDNPGSVSLPYAAEFTKEFGDGVALAEAGGSLDSVTVNMVSWACQTGAVGDRTCVTEAGATFPQVLTLNVYGVTATDGLGELLVTKTAEFQVKYRPTASAECDGGSAGDRWMSPAGCKYGITSPVTFSGFGDVTLPERVIVTVAFGTSRTDPSITGAPADSLNVAVTSQSPSVGANYANDAWINTLTGRYYGAPTAPNLTSYPGLSRTTSAYDFAPTGNWHIPQIEIRVVAEPEPTPTATPTPTPTPTATPTPTPTDTPPFPPTGDELNAGNANGWTVTGSLVAGGTVTLHGGAAAANKSALGFVFPTPTPLGTLQFNAAGDATFVLPTSLAAGEHRIAAYAADGTVLGWVTVVLADPLPATGTSSLPLAAVAAVLLLAGATFVTLGRRKALRR